MIQVNFTVNSDSTVNLNIVHKDLTLQETLRLATDVLSKEKDKCDRFGLYCGKSSTKGLDVIFKELYAKIKELLQKEKSYYFNFNFFDEWMKNEKPDEPPICQIVRRGMTIMQSDYSTIDTYFGESEGFLAKDTDYMLKNQIIGYFDIGCDCTSELEIPMLALSTSHIITDKMTRRKLLLLKCSKYRYVRNMEEGGNIYIDPTHYDVQVGGVAPW